ncbi:MAG: DUF815 domain-containing protein [Butyricicoccaceae bacterium]
MRRATASSHSPRRLPCRTTARRPDRASRCHPSARPARLRDAEAENPQNTLAFLDGRDANNILLYGDKGTGKSSTVKRLPTSTPTAA